MKSTLKRFIGLLAGFFIVLLFAFTVPVPVSAEELTPDAASEETAEATATSNEDLGLKENASADESSAEDSEVAEGVALESSTVYTVDLSECAIAGARRGILDHTYTGNAFTLEDANIVVYGASLKKAGLQTKLGDEDGIYITDGITWNHPASVANAGTYTVMVTPNGKATYVYAYTGDSFWLRFSGSVSETIEVRPCNISNATVSNLQSSLALGAKQKPVLTYNGKTLKEGIDYTLEYTCAERPGTAHLNIKGKGNFNGNSWYSYTVVGTFPTVSYAGAERWETASKINKAELAYGSYKGVIVASGEEGRYADALCASGLSGLLDYPIVLVNGSGSKLSSQSSFALSQLAAKNSGKLNIIVVGGTSAVNNTIEKALRSYGSVTRLGGTTRYKTSQLVYQYGESHGGWNKDYAIIARGDNFADSLSIAPFATVKKLPVILVDSKASSVDAYFASKLGSYKNAVVLGGKSAVSSGVESQVNRLVSGTSIRLAGDTRYQTSSAIATWELAHGMSATNMGFATGEKFPDSLASGFLLAKMNAPLVLVPSNGSSLDQPFKTLIFKYGCVTSKLAYFGGTSAISTTTRNAIATVFTNAGSGWIDENSGDFSSVSSWSTCGVCGYTHIDGLDKYHSHELQYCPTCKFLGTSDDLWTHLKENAFGYTSCNGGNFNNTGSENINRNHRSI